MKPQTLQELAEQLLAGKLSVDDFVQRLRTTSEDAQREFSKEVSLDLDRERRCGFPEVVYGDGKQTRSFCYVDDLVDGLLKLMESDYQRPINLGNPEEYKILDLASMVLQVTNRKSEVTFRDLPEDDPQKRCPDISVAEKVLSWSPKISLMSGLSKSIDWFRSKIK